MVYLIGVTICGETTSYKKARRFKKLRIPFNSERELETFRRDLEKQTPGKVINFISVEIP